MLIVVSGKFLTSEDVMRYCCVSTTKCGASRSRGKFHQCSEKIVKQKKSLPYMKTDVGRVMTQMAQGFASMGHLF